MKIKYSRNSLDLKILDMTISSHIISFLFLLISGHLWITQENQNGLIQSRRISCNWGKNFPIISKRKDFQSQLKKLLISLITGEPVSVIFGDHEDLYISYLFCFSFVIDTAKPVCLDLVNSNIYSCILTLLKLKLQRLF